MSNTMTKEFMRNTIARLVEIRNQIAAAQFGNTFEAALGDSPEVKAVQSAIHAIQDYAKEKGIELYGE